MSSYLSTTLDKLYIYMVQVNPDVGNVWTVFTDDFHAGLSLLVYIGVVDFRVCLLLLYGIRAVCRVVVAIAEFILMCKHCWC